MRTQGGQEKGKLTDVRVLPTTGEMTCPIAPPIGLAERHERLRLRSVEITAYRQTGPW